MKLSISKKMWFGFSFVLLLLVLISVISIFTSYDLANKYKDIIDKDIEKINLVSEIEVIQKDMATAILEFVMFGSDEAVQKFDQEIEKGSVAARALIESVKDEESQKLLKDLQTETVQLFESNDKIIKLKKVINLLNNMQQSQANLTAMLWQFWVS